MWANKRACGLVATPGPLPFPFPVCVLQVLRYFDYVFTGVFTFEMVIKVKASREKLGSGVGMGHGSVPLEQCCFPVLPPTSQ